jgi:hypothetical protein
MNITIKTQAALDALPIGAKIKVNAPDSIVGKAFSTTLTKTKREDWADGTPNIVWANTTGGEVTIRFYRADAVKKGFGGQEDKALAGLATITSGRFSYGQRGCKFPKDLGRYAEITLHKAVSWDGKKTDVRNQEGYYDKSKTFFLLDRTDSGGWAWCTAEGDEDIHDIYSRRGFEWSIKEAKKKAEESVIAKVIQANSIVAEIA